MISDAQVFSIATRDHDIQLYFVKLLPMHHELRSSIDLDGFNLKWKLRL